MILTLYAPTLGTFSTASMIAPAVEAVLPAFCTEKKVEFMLPVIEIPFITEPVKPDAERAHTCLCRALRQQLTCSCHEQRMIL